MANTILSVRDLRVNFSLRGKIYPRWRGKGCARHKL